jgi:capsule polysaccharide export protein KpsE/RkpR
MATREITKRPRYTEPELEPELIGVSEQHDREIQIDNLRVLWERRALIYRWAMIALVASTIVVFLIPARYTATTRLMPPDKATQGIASVVSALGKGGDLSALGGELLGVKTSGDLFIGVLKSETVEDALVNKFDLRKVYHVKRWQDARRVLEDRTDLTTDRKSGIISVRVTDRNPQRAAEMGREYVEQLNRVVISLDTSAAHRERIFLEARLKEVQQDLEGAEKDFSQFASKNAALDVKEQGRAMIGATGELEGQLIAAETELEGLRQIYTSNNVRVRSLEARISEYKRQLQRMGGQSGVPPEASTENGGEADQQLVHSIRQLPLLGVTWSDLYRRTKVEEAVFETLTKQYEMARVEEAREVPTVKVLDVASVPEKKSFPPRLLMIFGSTLLACALGAFWAIKSAHWEQVEPDNPRKVLINEILNTYKSKFRHAKTADFQKESPQQGS